MKKIRLISILAFAALILTSCGWFEPIIPVDTRTHYYFLHLSFKDAAGNDLIAPLAEEYYRTSTDKPWRGEIDPAEYTISLTVPEASGDSVKVNFTASKFTDEYVKLTPREDGTYGPDGRWFFDLRSIVVNKNDASYSKLNYKFSCPDVFGDDSLHEIATTWTKDIDANQQTFYLACTKVIIDGKEYTPLRGMTYYQDTETIYIAYFVDVVLGENVAQP